MRQWPMNSLFPDTSNRFFSLDRAPEFIHSESASVGPSPSPIGLFSIIGSAGRPAPSAVARGGCWHNRIPNESPFSRIWATSHSRLSSRSKLILAVCSWLFVLSSCFLFCHPERSKNCAKHCSYGVEGPLLDKKDRPVVFNRNLTTPRGGASSLVLLLPE
jgi:hypothetical protein